MRLLILSDLHLEHRPLWSIPRDFPPYDVAVFAGDVAGSPADAVEALAEAPGLQGRPVIFVPGNHEYYGGEIAKRLEGGRARCAGSSVLLLDRNTAKIEGVRFVGATLWTDYALFGDPTRDQAECLRTMNDHRLIDVEGGGGIRRFRPSDARERHVGDFAFIEKELALSVSGPTVVVTHHAPHPGSVHPRYAADPTSAAFASDLSDAIGRLHPALWVHGHTHNSFDYRAGATRIVCNPKGYGPSRSTNAGIENAEFKPDLVLEVS